MERPPNFNNFSFCSHNLKRNFETLCTWVLQKYGDDLELQDLLHSFCVNDTAHIPSNRPTNQVHHQEIESEKDFQIEKNKIKLCSLKHPTGEKPYKCNHCFKTFAAPSTLKFHERTHTGEKPYKCKICSAAFTQSGVLKTHERTHTGEKPYECNQCLKTFSQSAHLTTHRRRVHTGEKPYECLFCGKRFVILGNLKQHLSVHTGEKPFLCLTCGKGYTHKPRLRQHINEKHPDNLKN